MMVESPAEDLSRRRRRWARGPPRISHL